MLVSLALTKGERQQQWRGFTISPILKRLHFHPRRTVSARIFGVPPDVLPRKVGSEPVHFRTVVSDEEYEILGGEVSCPTSASQIARLNDLHMLQSGSADVR